MDIGGVNMKRVLEMPTGKVEIVFAMSDFLNLVEEEMGQASREIVQDLIDKADYTTRKLDTDLEAYEMDLESRTMCLQDVGEGLSEMRKLTENRRVLTKIDNLCKKIDNEI